MKLSKALSAALAAAGMGYAIGNLNPAYVMGLRRGYDIRKKGSGNAGATNLMILEGKKAGAFVMCFDISKAAVSVGLARRIFAQSKFAGEAAGAACILGHMYPALMRFRGGKGLACLGGVILAYDLRVFLALLVAELLLTLLLDYICVVPITASAVFPFIYGALSHDVRGALVFGIAGVVMLFKHIENLVRIHEGKEVHLSFLWKRDEEIDRVSHTPKD